MTIVIFNRRNSIVDLWLLHQCITTLQVILGENDWKKGKSPKDYNIHIQRKL